MKVITIKQPFASLILEGYKEYEFRTWKTNYRGEVYIHAAKLADKKAMKKYESYHLDCPLGCIIAKVEITDCIKIDDDARKMLKEKNDFVYENVIKNKEWEGYGFKIENVQKVDKVYLKGQLGFWNYEE